MRLTTLHTENNRYREYKLLYYFRVIVMKWFFQNWVINILTAILNYLLNIFYFCKRVTKKFQYEDYSVA